MSPEREQSPVEGMADTLHSLSVKLLPLEMRQDLEGYRREKAERMKELGLKGKNLPPNEMVHLLEKYNLIGRLKPQEKH